MSTELSRHVDTISHALFAIKDLFHDPATLHFGDIHKEMERFEAAFNVKASLDAFFAFLCERCRFGVVGTASPRSWYRCSTYPVLQGVFFHS